jgi:Fur family transcriptional regulator, ferric uptake regulator
MTWDADESPANLLRSAGLRVTDHRILLLNLMSSQSGHLAADELYRMAREDDPSLSLSTIYRTVRTLRDHGLIEERHLQQEHHHYEVKARGAHHHLICLGCGAVVEFDSPRVGQLRREIGTAHDFHVTDASIDLTGYCARCQREDKLLPSPSETKP